VATALNQNGFATLLTDLLTPEEQESDTKSQRVMGRFPGIVLNKFNIRLLSDRLKTITNWAITRVQDVKSMPIGYFGASTGAAAAIEAAAVAIESGSVSDKIYAIVSRGGRPDLADSDDLKNLKAAALFIVGVRDSKDVLDLNKKALKQLKNAKAKDMAIVPNAGHLFEEPGTMEKVAGLATQWFTKNL
jgi:dienelactone hydrolase